MYQSFSVEQVLNHVTRTGLYHHYAYKDNSGTPDTGEQTIATEQTDEIQKILKKFPFYGRNSERQVTVLSRYLIEAPGKNKQDTAEELDVNRNTVNKIEASWDDLPVGEKIELMQFLQQKIVEEHFSTPEQLSGRPETA